MGNILLIVVLKFILIFYKKNTPLPNIIWGEKSIIMASNLEFVDDNNYKYLWNLNAHEKIGVTIDNKIACFADANHRHSEVSHAGIMVSKLYFIMFVIF